MTTKQLRQLSNIIDHYGVDRQEYKAIEECSELTKEICKFREAIDAYNLEKYNRESIIDKIADVEVMINQLKIIFDCYGEVEDRINYKIERQIERIKGERDG